ncbi:MAG: FtsW/RodA/SpoVE family cell cycle protein [Candidatus Cryptobacteroides sp.]
MGRKRVSIWTFADRLQGDKVVWIIVLMLFLCSIVCMFSSTSRLLKDDMSRVDLLSEQLITVLMGLALVVIIYNIRNIKAFRIASSLGLLVSFVFLFLLDIRINTPFIRAIETNNAYRILSVNGFQIHVFEIVKVAMVMYLAWAVDAIRNGCRLMPGNNLSQKWKKIIYLYVPFIVILVMIIPGSNSSALFIGGIMYIVILLGGGNVKDLLLLALCGIATIGICLGIYHISDGKVLGRIGTGISRVFESTDWEKQFDESKKGSLAYVEALDKLRQPYGARIAIKEGGLLGKGPGESTQKYKVPDYSEDYMFSFIIEEFGLWGALTIIILYLSLLARGSIIVRNCGNDIFAKVAVAGLCLLISGQAFLHIFVNVDIGPMTGQTLPLISHGTSAFICFCVAFGIILSLSRIAGRRIDRETRDAEPLMEIKDNMRASLDDLDAYESGEMPEEEI